MSATRIVLLSLTRMGDLVQSSSLIRLVKREYPDSEIVLIALKAFAETAARLPMIDHVIKFDLDSFVESLERENTYGFAAHSVSGILNDPRVYKPNLLINLSHTERSATLAHLIEPKEVVGICRDSYGALRLKRDWFAYLLSVLENRTCNPYNLVEIYNNFAVCGHEISKLELAVTTADRSSIELKLQAHGIEDKIPMVVLQPGASHPSRCWPVESYLELAKSFCADGYQVVITGDEREQNLANSIAEACDCNVVSLAGQTTIGDLAALLEKAKLLISNDTGTGHIAAAVGTRVLGIYLGPAAAKDTAPYGTGHIILEANLPCAPCDYSRICSEQICKRTVTVDQVRMIANTMLSNLGQRPLETETVRAYQTFVATSGGFHLLPLTRSAELEAKRLNSYRTFWENLFSAKKTRVRRIGLSDSESVACRKLSDLSWALRHTLDSTSDSQLDSLLSSLANDLCTIDNSGVISAAARFLLVKLRFMHSLPADSLRAELKSVSDYLIRVTELLRVEKSESTIINHAKPVAT